MHEQPSSEAEELVAPRASWVSYAILVSFMLAMKLTIMGAGVDVDGFAMVFFLALDAGRVRRRCAWYLASRPAGFTPMWDREIGARRRFLAPRSIGISFGLLTIYRDHLSSFGGIHLPLRVAIPAFSYGAIFIEILYRSFARTTPVWFVSNIMLRGRGKIAAFCSLVRISAKPGSSAASVFSLQSPCEWDCTGNGIFHRSVYALRRQASVLERPASAGRLVLLDLTPHNHPVGTRAIRRHHQDWTLRHTLPKWRASFT